MNLKAKDRGERILLAVAGAGAAAVAISIIIGSVLGELPHLLWLLCVPIGLLGGAITCLASLALLFSRRASASARRTHPGQ